MSKHRTIFGSPAIGKIRPLPVMPFRCPKTGKLKIAHYSVMLITVGGVSLQFVTAQLYKDQNGMLVDLLGRTVDLSLLPEYINTKSIPKRHNIKHLKLYESVAFLNFYDPETEYNPRVCAEMIAGQLNDYLNSTTSDLAWFAPAGVAQGNLSGAEGLSAGNNRASSMSAAAAESDSGDAR